MFLLLYYYYCYVIIMCYSNVITFFSMWQCRGFGDRLVCCLTGRLAGMWWRCGTGDGLYQKRSPRKLESCLVEFCVFLLG